MFLIIKFILFILPYMLCAKGQGVLVGTMFQSTLHVVIVYVNHFGLYRKTVFLNWSLCLCVMVIPYTGSTSLHYMVRVDPEPGTDHSLK